VFKAFYHAPRHMQFLNLTDAFWESYSSAMIPFVSSNEYESLISRSIQNFAGCTLARLVGKSKIDYLTDPLRREALFNLGQFVLTNHPKRWAVVHELLCHRISEVH
jgi:hypothetical protein